MMVNSHEYLGKRISEVKKDLNVTTTSTLFS